MVKKIRKQAAPEFNMFLYYLQRNKLDGEPVEELRESAKLGHLGLPFNLEEVEKIKEEEKAQKNKRIYFSKKEEKVDDSPFV